VRSKLVHEANGARTFILVLDAGDEAVASLTQFAAKNHLAASHFTAIGAFSTVVVAYFDWPTKTYQDIPIDEQVEVL